MLLFDFAGSASRWMLVCYCLLVLVCLPVCGFVSGNRARPREMADSRVLATARHIHICLRVAVLRDSSHFRGFRPAVGPKQSRAWHLWSSSSRSVEPRPRSRSPRRLSRRLHGVTRRNASSSEYRLLALRRVPPRIRRTESSRVAQLATRHAAPLPHYMLNPFKQTQQILTDILVKRTKLPRTRLSEPTGSRRAQMLRRKTRRSGKSGQGDV
jgi:hypothetical protein